MPSRSRALADRLRAPARFAAAFLVLWLVFGWIALRLPTLPDTDSYFHLGVARLYAQEGVVNELRWTRFSLLREGFGDKELLFHLLLVPFASGEGSDGGRWALAFWNALAVATLAAAGRTAVGSWGLLVPALLWLGSLDYLGRLIRLRPETPAMILFVVAALCAGSRRHRLLGLVALVFTLTYTAFHALLGLCLLWFLWQAWQDHGQENNRASPPWKGLAYPILGTGLGLLLHPHFPHNLLVWKAQSLDFFRWKNLLDVGTEIGAQATDQMLLQNLPWLLGCTALALAALTAKPNSDPSIVGAPLKGIADALTIAAACFGVLYLLMMRFSTHALPLLTLALLFRLAAAGRLPGRSFALPGGLRLPTVAALVLVLFAGAWRSTALLHGMATAGEREPEWRAFGQAVPEGARVAAPWGQTPIYLFWAPQASYLNVLDPVFMAVPYPDVYRLQRSLFDGTEPDVPLAVAAGLGSDHLAISRFLAPPKLLARLEGDPRARLVYGGWTLLYAFEPPPKDVSGAFLTEWRLVPEGTPLPISPSTDTSPWAHYPRTDAPELRALEAYVDGRRIPRSGRCFAATRDLSPGPQRFELASAGPMTLWYQPEGAAPGMLRILDAPGAVLGRGVRFEIEEGGMVRLTVLSCAPHTTDPAAADRAGFYLRRLN